MELLSLIKYRLGPKQITLYFMVSISQTVINTSIYHPKCHSFIHYPANLILLIGNYSEHYLLFRYWMQREDASHTKTNREF